jgi:hypothetical protein
MTRRAEVIRAAIDAAIEEVRVALPGVVESVDVSAQTVDVRPLMLNRRIDDAGKVTQEELPKLPSVPISWPRAGGFFVTLPITKGDTGLIVFPDYSIDQWRAKGGSIPVDPLDVRSHSLTSAIFFPGLHAKNSALNDAHAANMVLGKDGGSQIHIKPTGEIHIGSESASDFVALAQKVLTELQSIQTWANLHTHVAPSGATGTAIPSLNSPGSVAAAKTKAD